MGDQRDVGFGNVESHYWTSRLWFIIETRVRDRRERQGDRETERTRICGEKEKEKGVV